MSSLIDVLTRQHRRVIELLDETEESPKSRVLEELADRLVGHTLTEEELVYPLALAAAASEARAREEHAVLHYALERLLVARPGHQTFDARLRVLRDLVIHHWDAEERARLPALVKEIGPRKSRALAARVASRFEELVALGHREALRERT